MGKEDLTNKHGLNDDDINKIISDATFFFLVADQKKALIKRSDLVKACGLSGKEKKIQDHVLESAKDRLMRIFGIKAEESEKKGCFYLVNMLTENQDDDGFQHIMWGEKENGQMAITFIILGLVFMSNGSKISEENLFKFLRHLGVCEEDRKSQRRANDSSSDSLDPELSELVEGDVKKFINDILVSRQHYLVKTREDTGDPEVESYSYSWGERARLEVKESDVLKMICEVYDCEPRMFKEQFDRVLANEPDFDNDS